jgi:prepilin-type N-terminal cleavage/methylation domain-containing protein
MNRRGFSFAEVMFAVVILGIGFVMMAGLFPVAIRQTATVVEENDATALTKKAVEQLRQMDDMPSFPVTSQVVTGDPFGGGSSTAVVTPGRMFAVPDPRMMVDDDPNNAPNAQGSLGVQNELWRTFKSRLISDDDRRLAYVMLYRRDQPTGAFPLNMNMKPDATGALGAAAPMNGTPSPVVQVTIIAYQNRTGRDFDPVLDFPQPHSITSPPQDFPLPDPSLNLDDELPTLWPRPVEVLLTEGGGEPDRITIRDIGLTDAPVGNDVGLAVPQAWQAAAEGAYIVISDSRIAPTAGPTGTLATGMLGRSNGRVYRLGNEIPPGTSSGTDEITFELAPGDDMAYTRDNPATALDEEVNEQLPVRDVGSPPPLTGWAYAFIVGGRAMRDPAKPFDRDTNPYEGLAQAMTAFTTFIQVK